MTVDASLVERIVAHRSARATFFSVRTVPDAERARLLANLQAPLVTAYHLGAKIVTVWQHHAGGAFCVRLGGTHGFPMSVTRPDGTHGVLFPPGTTATFEGEATDVLVASLGEFPCWQRLGAVADLIPDDHGEIRLVEDHASLLSSTPFALLTVAVPIAMDTIREQQGTLVEDLVRGQQDTRPGVSELMSTVVRSQLAERVAATGGGLWRIHCLVGAGDTETARAIAATWGANVPVTGGLAYRLTPVGVPGPLSEVLAGGVSGDSRFEPAAPFSAGPAVLAGVCRPPLLEVPGIASETVNTFDVAAPPGPQRRAGGMTSSWEGVAPLSSDSGVTRANDARGANGGTAAPIMIGHVLDAGGLPVGPCGLSLETLNHHSFVHGATGAGKSQAVRHVLTELSRQGVPWIVLEPAKREYAAGMAERLASAGDAIADAALRRVHVVRPADLEATPVSLHPLQPEPGASYQAHLDGLLDLMVTAFDADSPFPEVLTQAMDRCVRRAGWDPGTSRPLRALADRYADGATGPLRPLHPGIDDLVRACHQVIDEKGYGREVAGNVHGFVDMRLGTLLTGTKRAAFSAGYPLSLPAVLQTNAVLELQDLGTDSDRALFMGLFLARLAAAVRVRARDDPRPGRLRNVVVIEEAHRLLRNPETLTGAAARAVESFTNLLAEVRSLGVGLIVAEQIPTKIAPDVVKNTATKLMGRTPAADDRELVGDAIGLTAAQSQQVVSLEPGRFALHSDGFDRPMLVQLPYVAEHGARDGDDPAALVEDLPPWFGEASPAGAASQADLAHAAELIEDTSLALLVDVTTLVHLVVGDELQVPVLQPHDRARLRAVMDGVGQTHAPGDLAIGLLAQTSVISRRSVLGAYAPESLVAEVAARVRRSLRDANGGPVAPEWKAAPDRVAWVRAALVAALDSGHAQPHPYHRRWHDVWGIELDEVAATNQLAQLDARYPIGADSLSALCCGDQPPSLLGRVARRHGYTHLDAANLFRRRCVAPSLDRVLRRVAQHHPQPKAAA